MASLIGWEDGVLGPGGIWGRVQGVGSDHWGTRSQPSLGLHPRAARTRAKRAFLSSKYNILSL